jgi:hypothetical protein
VPQMFMVLSWIITIAPSLTIPILVGAYGRVLRAKRSQMRRLFRPGSMLEKIYLTAFPDQGICQNWGLRLNKAPSVSYPSDSTLPGESPK